MKPGDHSTKKSFSVNASPLNPVKLELAIILLVGLLLWLLLDSITESQSAQIAILFLYSFLGAIWLLLRTRYVVLRTKNNNRSDSPQRAGENEE